MCAGRQDKQWERAVPPAGGGALKIPVCFAGDRSLPSSQLTSSPKFLSEVSTFHPKTFSIACYWFPIQTPRLYIPIVGDNWHLMYFTDTMAINIHYSMQLFWILILTVIWNMMGYGHIGLCSFVPVVCPKVSPDWMLHVVWGSLGEEGWKRLHYSIACVHEELELSTSQ